VEEVEAPGEEHQVEQTEKVLQVIQVDVAVTRDQLHIQAVVVPGEARP
jgi:hypothetical protein